MKNKLTITYDSRDDDYLYVGIGGVIVVFCIATTFAWMAF